MQLWRDYLEKYADEEGDVESQALVAACKSVEVLSCLSEAIDKDGNFKSLIAQRQAIFLEGARYADSFLDRLVNATFSIYNCFNTLSHQFAGVNAQAARLIRDVDLQVHETTGTGDPLQRAAAALRASFALVGLIAIALDHDRSVLSAIRHIEQRFADASRAAASDGEQLLNALYRIVEMMQVFALLTDPDLRDQINQIATRFQEEDQEKEIRYKLRNGFCRLFELGHLLAIQYDAKTS